MLRLDAILVALIFVASALVMPPVALAKSSAKFRGREPAAVKEPPPQARKDRPAPPTKQAKATPRAASLFIGQPLGADARAELRRPQSQKDCLSRLTKARASRVRRPWLRDATSLCPPGLEDRRVVTGPAAKQVPVVYAQSVVRANDTRYELEDARWQTLRYHPAGLGAVAPIGIPLFSAIWHKNRAVTAFETGTNLRPSRFDELDAERSAAGYRVLDLDAHVDERQVRLHAIWIKEDTGAIGRAHYGLTHKQLQEKIEEYRNEGFRPTKINGYRVEKENLYAAVWVDDGLRDFTTVIAVDSNQYAEAWTLYRSLGYVPVDLAAFPAPRTRYAGIWVRDAGVRGWESRRGLTRQGLDRLLADAKKKNLVLVDLDSYRDGKEMRHAAILHRRPKRNSLISNLPLSGPSIDALEAVIEEFITDGADSARGSLGFFIQDIDTGSYIALNPHEPHYMASTSKVLIAGKVLETGEIALDDIYELTETDWRGEDSRGFAEDDQGEDFPVKKYMKNMLRRSDTASTDKLHGLVEDFHDEGTFDDYLADDVDLQNVGELTSICELDKRIFESFASCLRDVPCDVFETYFRGQDPSRATASELACLTAALPGFELGTGPYYATLANTITPAAYGRFWKRTTTDATYAAGNRQVLFDLMGAGRGYNPAGHEQAKNKGGAKNRVASKVGFLEDPDLGRISFALFTEDWHWDFASEFICTSGVLCGLENATECAQQIVTDAAACGTEIVECSVEVVTSAAECGTDLVTSISECGTTLVTDAAECGTELVDDIVTCGLSLGGECEVAATCEVAASCSVPRRCEVSVFCEEPVTCAIETCEPILCEEEEIECETTGAWTSAAMKRSLKHAVDFLMAAKAAAS